MRWKISIFILAILTVILFAYRQHHRVVIEGTFLGLTIGESKTQVFENLVERPDVSAISPRVPAYYVTSENITELSRLSSIPAFVIDGPRFQITVTQKD